MAAGAGSAGSPCGACKFLRRKCTSDCIFAPYFCSEQGPARFAAIHKVFGASNVSKLLAQVPVQDRCEAVVTIAYEAQARIRDPVYGCVAHIFALQQQVAYLQAQLMQLRGQNAVRQVEQRSLDSYHLMGSGNIVQQINSLGYNQSYYNHQLQHISPQSSPDSSVVSNTYQQKMVISSDSDLGDLQDLAFGMMRN